MEEVSNYVRALEYGRKLLKEGTAIGLPLWLDLHRILLTGQRGGHKLPGQLRTSQNWIGGSNPAVAAFVPPPAAHVPRLMKALEEFVQETGSLPAVIKIGLCHAQLETIHPFADGNGRMGRLLIALMLESEGVLPHAYCYPSLYLRMERQRYYEQLQRIRTHGDWEGWLSFFLEAIAVAAREAAYLGNQVQILFEADMAHLREAKVAHSVFAAYELMQRQVHVKPRQLEAASSISFPAAVRALERLVVLGIAQEITGFRRNRVYRYMAFGELLR